MIRERDRVKTTSVASLDHTVSGKDRKHGHRKTVMDDTFCINWHRTVDAIYTAHVGVADNNRKYPHVITHRVV